MTLFAGVDGGGSKTLAVLIDQNGQEVGRGRADSANYQLFSAQGYSAQQAAHLAAEQVAQAIRQALPAGESAGSLLAAFAGLAGIDTPVALELVNEQLANTALVPSQKWQLVNDAQLVLYGLPNRQGLGLIAGTGSIAVGCNSEGRTARSGGWGYLLGDEGSGYQIGQAALQAITRAADGRGKATRLLPRVLSEWQLAEPAQLIEAVYSRTAGQNQKIARLAPLVFELAAEGDPVAKRLAKQAALQLAVAVRAVYRQLYATGQPYNLAFGGGLLLNTPALKTAILQYLTRLSCTPTQVFEVSDPAKAAALACLEFEKNQQQR